MHLSTNANYSAYTYTAFIIIDNSVGSPFTINGTTFSPPNEWDGQVIPLTVNQEGTPPNNQLLLLGNPKPEYFRPGPPGQGGVTTDGYNNIKG
jgi:hypothetical protein